MEENEIKEFNNVKEIIYNSAKVYNEKIAYVIKHKNNDNVEYENISYKKLLEDINALGASFYHNGFRGKRVAIIGKNTYEWEVTHLTNLLGSIISIPLDKDLQSTELENSLIRSKADCLVFDQKVKDRVKEVIENNKTNVKTFYCIGDVDGFKNIRELIKEGYELEKEKEEFINNEIDNNIMNVLLFTSGTTSKSKAVMLSQKNIASNIYAMRCCEDIRETDTNIAFLPFHHVFGSTGMIMMLVSGVKNVFPDGLRYIKQNLNEYKVSIFIGVPVLVEAIYKTILKEIKKQGKEKSFKFGIKLSRFLLKFKIDIRKKLFKSIIDSLGGELRFMISGGAPADPVISRGFNDIGIKTVQGYGLTETSPVIASEDDNHIKPGTVGVPMKNVELKIDSPDENGIGEIIVKGPNVMLGYYEMPEETKAVLKDGWFHTGDLGYIDKNGFVCITGRNKNLIVLKNGKKVFPEELETVLSRIDLIKESMVFGLPDENDKNDIMLSVKVVYNKDVVKEKYSDKTLDEVKQILWNQIKDVNTTFPRYKHIQNMIFTDKDLIKTTTNKVKRQEEMKLILEEKI